jgi:hypothetical protein
LVVAGVLGLWTTSASSAPESRAAGCAKQYGAFTVPPGVWVKTNIALEEGDSFSVSVTGFFKYKEHPFTEFGAGGNILGRFVLKGKIGKQLVNVGAGGGGTAAADGKLELGAPSWEKMGEGEEPGLDPAYAFKVRVCVTPQVVTYPAVWRKRFDFHTPYEHLVAPGAAFPYPGPNQVCAGPKNARMSGQINGRMLGPNRPQGGGWEQLYLDHCQDPGIHYRLLDGTLVILKPGKRLLAHLRVQISGEGGADSGHPVGECRNGLIGRIEILWDKTGPDRVSIGGWNGLCRSHTHTLINTPPGGSLKIFAWIGCVGRSPQALGIGPELCK